MCVYYDVRIPQLRPKYPIMACFSHQALDASFERRSRTSRVKNWLNMTDRTIAHRLATHGSYSPRADARLRCTTSPLLACTSLLFVLDRPVVLRQDFTQSQYHMIDRSVALLCSRFRLTLNTLALTLLRTRFLSFALSSR